jgi:hypothetical protein
MTKIIFIRVDRRREFDHEKAKAFCTCRDDRHRPERGIYSCGGPNYFPAGPARVQLPGLAARPPGQHSAQSFSGIAASSDSSRPRKLHASLANALGRTSPLIKRTSAKRDQSLIISNRCGICSRHEIRIPQTPLPAFLPHRLRLAYGVWTEPGGAEVLFSRDYAPMWRLRDGLPAQQVSPTEWIKFEHQKWFWEDATAPWEDPRRIAEEEARLKSFGITGLPALVDLLPIMVSSTGNVEMPRRVLEALREPKALAG